MLKFSIELIRGDLIWIAENDGFCAENLLAELVLDFDWIKNFSMTAAYGKIRSRVERVAEKYIKLYEEKFS